MNRDPHGIRTSARVPNPLPRNTSRGPVHELSTFPSLETLAADLDRRIQDAKRIGATAPVAATLGDVLEQLRRVSAVPETPAELAPAPKASSGRLLTPREAAERIGMSVRWLYRHARSLPFTRRLSRRALRFDERGLERWAASRRS